MWHRRPYNFFSVIVQELYYYKKGFKSTSEYPWTQLLIKMLDVALGDDSEAINLRFENNLFDEVSVWDKG